MNTNDIGNISKFIHSLEQDEKNFLLKMAIIGSGLIFSRLATDYRNIFLDILNSYQTILFHAEGPMCAVENDYDKFLDLIVQMKEYVANNGMDKR